MNESALAAVTRGAGEMCSFKNVAPVGSGEKGCKYFVMVGIFEAFVVQSFLSGPLASECTAESCRISLLTTTALAELNETEFKNNESIWV